jgi:hypothetical protein
VKSLSSQLKGLFSLAREHYAGGRMSAQAIIHALWYLQMAVEVVLSGIVIGKKSWREVPGFSAYVLFATAASLVKYAVREHGMVYFYTYWICEAIAIVLGLVVVREIFMKIFTPHMALRKLATLIFRTAVILLVAFGCIAVYLQTPGAQGISNSVLIGEEATRIIEVGLIMFLFLSSSAFGLHWRQNVFGIALGLGIFTAVELVMLAVRLHVGPGALRGFSIARLLAFDLSLFVWAGYLVVPERVPSSAEIPKQAQLEQWNQAVMELISR